jgi:hypothetical protein
LGRQILILRGVGGGGLLLLVFLIVVTSSAAAPPLHQVKAPFRVFDAGGNLALEVKDNPHSVGLYRPDNQIVPAVIASAPAAGHHFFKTETPDQNVQAAFGIVDGNTPTMVLRYGGPDHNLLTMAVANEVPCLNMSSADGRVVAGLCQGESGGGSLMLTNGAGGTIMQAGTTARGVGSVTVFPERPAGSLPVAPIAAGAFALREENRLPGTFICGTGCQ